MLKPGWNLKVGRPVKIIVYALELNPFELLIYTIRKNAEHETNACHKILEKIQNSHKILDISKLDELTGVVTPVGVITVALLVIPILLPLTRQGQFGQEAVRIDAADVGPERGARTQARALVEAILRRPVAEHTGERWIGDFALT